VDLVNEGNNGKIFHVLLFKVKSLRDNEQIYEAEEENRRG